jgi:hypothetical protein
MDPTREPDKIDYERALAAYEAGQKLHVQGHIYLVRPILTSAGSPPGSRPVLWMTDERTTGEHGFILFPDGHVEAR